MLDCMGTEKSRKWFPPTTSAQPISVQSPLLILPEYRMMWHLSKFGTTFSASLSNWSHLSILGICFRPRFSWRRLVLVRKVIFRLLQETLAHIKPIRLRILFSRVPASWVLSVGLSGNRRSHVPRNSRGTIWQPSLFSSTSDLLRSLCSLGEKFCCGGSVTCPWAWHSPRRPSLWVHVGWTTA